MQLVWFWGIEWRHNFADDGLKRKVSEMFELMSTKTVSARKENANLLCHCAACSEIGSLAILFAYTSSRKPEELASKKN